MKSIIRLAATRFAAQLRATPLPPPTRADRSARMAPVVLRCLLLGILVSAPSGCELGVTEPAVEEELLPELPRFGTRWVSAGPDTLFSWSDSTAGYCILGPVEIVLTGEPEFDGHPIREKVRYPARRSAFSLECHGADESALEVFSIPDSVLSYDADTLSVGVSQAGCIPFGGGCDSEPSWWVSFRYAGSFNFLGAVRRVPHRLEGIARWRHDDPNAPLRARGQTGFRLFND